MNLSGNYILTIINLLFNLLLTVAYFMAFFYGTGFNINNSTILNTVLIILFFGVFPPLSVCLNNVFLLAAGKKNWRTWLKIPQQWFYQIFTNIEIGWALVSLAPFFMFIFIYKEAFGLFMDSTAAIFSISRKTFTALFVTLYVIILILLFQVIRKLFVQKDAA
jgi:hypothetical protein